MRCSPLAATVRGLASAIALSVIAAPGAGCGKSHSDAATAIHWHRDFLVARDEAEVDHKPGIIIIIFFFASYCPGHHASMLRAFADPVAAKMALKDFVAVAIDASGDDESEGAELLAKLHVVELPSFVLVAPDFKTVLHYSSGNEDPPTVTAALLAARGPQK